MHSFSLHHCQYMEKEGEGVPVFRTEAKERQIEREHAKILEKTVDSELSKVKTCQV